MGKISIAAVFALLLTACLPVLLDGATTGQRLHAADGAYRTLLELAVAYRDACDTRPQTFQETCRPVVARLQAVDLRIATVRAGIDPAAPDPLAVQTLETALTELRATLITAQSQEVER